MDTSSVSIEELNGLKRLLILSGAAQPFRPAEWQSKQGLKTTWYTGNTRASQQILGPQDPPVKWSGKWSSTQLARTPALWNDGSGSITLNSPLALADAFESLQRQGALLRVTWATTSGDTPVSRVREGRIENFTQKPHTAYEVEWEANFEWVGRGNTDGQRVTSTRADDKASPGDFQTAIIAFNLKMDGLFGTTLKPGGSFAFSQLGSFGNLSIGTTQFIRGFINYVKTVQSNLDTLQQTFVSDGTQGYATRNAMAELASSVRSLGFSQQQQIGRTPSELQSSSDRVVDILYAMTKFGQTWVEEERLAGIARTLELNARANASQNPGGAKDATSDQPGSPLKGAGILAYYTCCQGDTPITVSLKFYQSPEFVLQVLKVNHMDWATTAFQVGQVLIIPVRPTNQPNI